AHAGFGGDDGDDVDHCVPLWSGDAFKDAVMASGREWADLRRPVAKGAGLLPGRTLQHVGRVDVVDREVPLHTGNGRVLEPIACGRAHAGHLREHRKVLGVIDAVELGLVFSGDVELDDKDVAHEVVPRGSGDLAEDAVLAVGRVRTYLGLPLAEIGGLLPGRAVDDLGRVDLVN